MNIQQFAPDKAYNMAIRTVTHAGEVAGEALALDHRHPLVAEKDERAREAKRG
jgi:hypothetical protein